jgi:hypothetical protein
MTSSSTILGATSYEPSAADCNSGLAQALLTDGKKLFGSKNTLLKTYIPPYEINISENTEIQVAGVRDLKVVRRADPLGNKIRVFYSLDGANADGLNFSREASLLVEASAWCDRLS